MPVGLLSLSTELLALIIAFAAEASPDLSRTSILCRLRLTCSRISASATPALFRSFILRPCDPSIARFHALLNDPSPFGPRSLVRRVVFESEVKQQHDDDCLGWSWEPELTELTREWYAAVSRLSELENVQHVYVRFAPTCLDTDDTGTGWIEAFPNSNVLNLRRGILVAVFKAIVGMRHSLRALSIENLLNFVDTTFTNKSCFTEVITSIQELHISIAADVDENDPANAFPLLPAIPRFWPSFASVWLAPASPRLISLTLYCNVEFGAVPYWQDCLSSTTASQDTAALAFPRLRSLTLGRYALAYESQLDDFLASAAVLPELRRLTLDDCPIVSHLSVSESD
ncbi:F-box domain-containing protein [Beauveria brongniartii RCEF 3172]|uniref:F-box domain-containing protein n=1 Tax=Beauveria brongniartii RCEF 3172 TaxID=1081107 RepID=A0A167K7Y3_9HYPO|nr:F-box domain-containing protein [Beauveria brongniartii RCEF 3172]